MNTIKLVYNSQNNNLSANAFIAKYAKSPIDFNMNIYAEDEVYLHGLKSLKNEDRALVLYFKLGANIMATVKQIAIWRFGGVDKISSFLDFACGYGRFARFLIQELSHKRIWASDIYAKAVNFQQEQFGVNAMASAVDPKEFVCNQKFDLILVASLFSHLPEKSFDAWLAKLHGLLSAKGILVLSVHDEYMLGDTPMPKAGFLFRGNSESKYLESDDYGTMIVSEPFVRDTINKVLGHNWSYYRIRRGFTSFQDIYLITQNPHEDFSSLNFRTGPEGHLDVCSKIGAKEINLGGWAGDLGEGITISDIQIIVNGKMVQRCLPFLERPDVVHALRQSKYQYSGWSCSCHLNKLDEHTDILEIKAASSDGIEALLHFGTLESSFTPK